MDTISFIELITGIISVFLLIVFLYIWKKYGRNGLRVNYILFFFIGVIILLTSMVTKNNNSINMPVTKNLQDEVTPFISENLTDEDAVKKIAKFTNLNQQKTKNVVDVFKRCGITGDYTIGINNPIDTLQYGGARGYVITYKKTLTADVLIGINGRVITIKTLHGSIYKNNQVINKIQDFYLSENDKLEILNNTYKKLIKYTTVSFKDKKYIDEYDKYIDNDWRVYKRINKNAKVIVVESQENNFRVAYSFDKKLKFVEVNGKTYFKEPGFRTEYAFVDDQ